jgi:hypothetical protein
MFAGQNLGISLAKGWVPVFTHLCESIDAVLGERRNDFAWVQVKEKFGTARLYYRLEGGGTTVCISVQDPEGKLVPVQESVIEAPAEESADLAKKIGDLVAEAETKLGKICIVCGEPAQMDRTGGYFLNLCAHHGAQRRKNPRSMESPWFAE